MALREISLRSRRKLKPIDARRFAHLGPDLFVELAQVVCSTGALPQKELHECWQMAVCVHKEFPDALRIADMAAGHGLLAWILVLLARSGDAPILRTAVAVDIRRPKSADILAAAMTARWPELADAVHYVEGSIDAVSSGDDPRTLFVAAHACGSLSDRVLLAAIDGRNPVAIMPCCHSLRKQTQTLSALALAAGLPSTAVGSVHLIDRLRIDALLALGYEMREASIQPEVTAFNRIIMGRPPRAQDHGATPMRPVPQLVVSVKRLGEIRAFEKVRSLDVSNAVEAQALSKRPSREWLRSFDLSYWVDDEATGHRLATELDRLTGREVERRAFTRTVSICDQYTDAVSQRLAFTYRVEIGSTTVEITRADATLLRRELCRALEGPGSMLRGV